MNEMISTCVPSIEEINASIRDVRARLRGHAGDLIINDINEEGEVSIEFIGACSACPAIGFTYLAIVEPALTEIEGVKSIKTHQVHLSPAFRKRMSAFTQGNSSRIGS